MVIECLNRKKSEDSGSSVSTKCMKLDGQLGDDSESSDEEDLFMTKPSPPTGNNQEITEETKDNLEPEIR